MLPFYFYLYEPWILFLCFSPPAESYKFYFINKKKGGFFILVI